MKSNILILHADQHKQSCLGVYGNREVQTPQLDALAADGVCYENSFTPYPVCTPSRYSLLTGLYAYQHLGMSNRCTLPQGLPTFPHLLRESGYRSAAVGKMHFTPSYADFGYDRLCLCEQDGDGRLDDDYHRYLRELGLWDCADTLEQVESYRQNAGADYWESCGARISDLPERHYSTRWIADRAAEELERWTDGGNLLTVGFVKPHHPFDPPQEWAERYDPEMLTLPKDWTAQCLAPDLDYDGGFYPHDRLTPATLRRCLAYYYAAITQLDTEVGRLLDILKRRGLYENTLIVYTSDHGDYMGARHMLGKGNYLYDALAKVPLLIKYPQHCAVPKGRDSSLVSNIDLAPTLLAAAGLPRAAGMSGRNLLESADDRDFVFSQHVKHRQYMLRSQTRKLLYCERAELCQFFDLEKDPQELENRYRDPAYQTETTAMKEALARLMLFDAPAPVHLDLQARRSPCPNARLGREEERRETLAYMQEKMKQYTNL